MLVITRTTDEQFYIGDDIRITVISTNRGKIRIGIDAPREVVVARDELLEDADPRKRRYKPWTSQR
jgi:carbon storage regulator